MFGDFVVQVSDAYPNRTQCAELTREIVSTFHALYVAVVSDDAAYLRGHERFILHGRYENGYTLVALALSYHSAACLRELDSMGLSMHHVRDSQASASYLVENDPDYLPTALALGVDPNARNSDGSTALFFCDSHNTARLLFKYGARADVISDNGITPMVVPIVMQAPHLLDLYLSRGFGDLPILSDGTCAIHVCALENYVQGVLRLIAHRCDLNITYNNATALQMCVRQNSYEVGVELLAAGAGPAACAPRSWRRAAAALVRERVSGLSYAIQSWMMVCRHVPEEMDLEARLGRVLDAASRSDHEVSLAICCLPMPERANNAHVSGMMYSGCRYALERILLKFVTDVEAEAHIRAFSSIRPRDMSLNGVLLVAKLGEAIRMRKTAEERVKIAFKCVHLELERMGSLADRLETRC